VGDGDDFDPIVQLAIHEEEREPIEETSARAAEECGPGSRGLEHARHGVIDFAEEGCRCA
jgi:hypothetical protein